MFSLSRWKAGHCCYSVTEAFIHGQTQEKAFFFYSCPCFVGCGWTACCCKCTPAESFFLLKARLLPVSLAVCKNKKKKNTIKSASHWVLTPSARGITTCKTSDSSGFILPTSVQGSPLRTCAKSLDSQHHKGKWLITAPTQWNEIQRRHTVRSILLFPITWEKFQHVWASFGHGVRKQDCSMQKHEDIN